ncbi:anthranilate phosphoribosyltransferase [Elasticomyces elasticus]|nr:anthranilate phosphoribosyltransferase [Elasticomyces elasticus]
MTNPVTPSRSISSTLARLASPTAASSISAAEIALDLSHIFRNEVSPVQAGILLYALHLTKLDRDPDVLAACASAMRDVAAQVDQNVLYRVVNQRGKAKGGYGGGLVGTGGDGHSTFNVSTTASILASPLLMIAKHGNNASTSKSGSADFLQATQPAAPSIDAITAYTLPRVYEKSNYAFLYAKVWHPGMRFAAPIRKELSPIRTIFNLLGPLANPVADTGLVEAQMVGVMTPELGPIFVNALKLSGANKALVVCGAEKLDELSCAGPSYCWRLRNGEIDHFVLSPSDFGLSTHPLSEVGGGKEPAENAEILMRILRNELPRDDPILHFVLLNTAALLVTAGVCDVDESDTVRETGPGSGRWKEGIRRARWCIESGAALREWEAFVEVSNSLVT